MISTLLDIGYATGGQETRIRRGESETRTIRPNEACIAAIQLMRTDEPSREMIKRARLIIRLAKWHKTGMTGELKADE